MPHCLNSSWEYSANSYANRAFNFLILHALYFANANDYFFRATPHSIVGSGPGPAIICTERTAAVTAMTSVLGKVRNFQRDYTSVLAFSNAGKVDNIWRKCFW